MHTIVYFFYVHVIDDDCHLTPMPGRRRGFKGKERKRQDIKERETPMPGRRRGFRGKERKRQDIKERETKKKLRCQAQTLT